MKVLGISGSPRREGNTDILVNAALEVLASEGLQTEFLSLAIDRSSLAWPAGAALPRIRSAVSRKTQHSRDPGQVRRGRWHIDRLASVLRVGYAADHGLAGPGWLRLPKASATAATEGGSGDRGRPPCRSELHFRPTQLLLPDQRDDRPGSTYWNVAFGREKGEVRNDAEGMDTVKNLAGNMAWPMKRLAIAADDVVRQDVPAAS